MNTVQPHDAHPDMPHADYLSTNSTATYQSAMKSYSAKDAAKVKATLKRQGIQLKDKARELGITPAALSNLINARSPAHWGKMHEAAVKLGLKQEVRQ